MTLVAARRPLSSTAWASPARAAMIATSATATAAGTHPEATLGGAGEHGRQRRHLGQQQHRSGQPGGHADGHGPAGQRRSRHQPPVEGLEGSTHPGSSSAPAATAEHPRNG